MNELMWGVLGPENVRSERRTRTLGLGAAVRNFNELAVPGVGGVWFAKQIFLALLGVAVAERVRQRGGRNDNIQLTNAIEALACWLEYASNGWESDDRLRGVDKLASASAPPSFAVFGSRGFYVTQPMRMSTVQALRSLGLVEGTSERFNAYRCSPTGLALIEAGCGSVRPRKSDPLEALAGWVAGDFDAGSESMRVLLSPVEPLPPPAHALLLECLCQGGGEATERRRAATEWVSALIEGQASGSGQPSQLSAQHWHDVQAGALFFTLQKRAIGVLDAVEVALAASDAHALAMDDAVGAAVKAAVEPLRHQAMAFLKHAFTDLAQTGANVFAHECADPSDLRVVEYLLMRDERVLRLRDGVVLPGPAFEPSSIALSGEDDARPAASALPLPNDVSYRIHNLYLFNLDLRGELHAWLRDGGTVENDDE